MTSRYRYDGLPRPSAYRGLSLPTASEGRRTLRHRPALAQHVVSIATPTAKRIQADGSGI
jgi:hypothetical protein